MPYTVDEFADKIKKKYPVYANLDNQDLVDKVIKKYPVYKDQLIPAEKISAITPSPAQKYVSPIFTEFAKGYGWRPKEAEIKPTPRPEPKIPILRRPTPEEIEAPPVEFEPTAEYRAILSRQLLTGVDKLSRELFPGEYKGRQREKLFMSYAPLIGMGFFSPVWAASFFGLDQLKSFIVSKSKGKEYSLYERRILAELIPEEYPKVRTGAAVGEWLGDIALVAATMNLAKQGLLTENIKLLGKKLTAAGYGEDVVTIPKEAIKAASKGTTVETEAARWLKIKSAKIPTAYKKIAYVPPEAPVPVPPTVRPTPVPTPTPAVPTAAVVKPPIPALPAAPPAVPPAPTPTPEIPTEEKDIYEAAKRTWGTSEFSHYWGQLSTPTQEKLIREARGLPPEVKPAVKPEVKPEVKPIPPELEPLAVEARKYKNAEEFEQAFSREIKYGKYWHVTENPNFKIDAELGPRDMSSMAMGDMEKGKLMITSDLKYWADYYKTGAKEYGAKPRKYVAEIDMSKVPDSAYKQVNRGFGNEFYVSDPAKANVSKVISIEQALKESEQFQKVLGKNIFDKKSLTDFYNQATKGVEVKPEVRFEKEKIRKEVIEQGILPETPAREFPNAKIEPKPGQVQTKFGPAPLVELDLPGMPKSEKYIQPELTTTELNIQGKIAKGHITSRKMGEMPEDEPPKVTITNREQISPEGVKSVNKADEEAQKLEELFAGIPFYKVLDIPVVIKGTKYRLIDALGSELIRWYGLTPETKKLFVEMLGQNEIRKRDIIKFIQEKFPITEEEAKLLRDHQEQPQKYPIPKNLEEQAKIIDNIFKTTMKMMQERELLKTPFPDSFIRRTEKQILQEEEIIPLLKQKAAIEKHKARIEELQEYKEFLRNLRYVPHIYRDEIERQVIRLLPEGRLTAKFRSAVTKLKGRKIDTYDKAKELGLIGVEDIRELLAAHIEYVFRKCAVYDTIEMLKKHPEVCLKEKEAPSEWSKVAISQLDGYLIHPLLTRAIEDFAITPTTSMIAKGYDAVNYLGKSIVFYNFIVMPFWDIFQASGAGTFQIHKPVYSILNLGKAWKDVYNETEFYKECIKKGIYTTPTVGKFGRFSPSMEESMRFVIDQVSEKNPGWRKGIEKVLGRKIDWKTISVLPELYLQNWRLTWFLDRVLRTASYRTTLDRGMDPDEGAEFTNNFHANFDLFTQTSKKWFNRAFLVPTYKANMLFNLPYHIGKHSGKLFRDIAKHKGANPTDKEYFKAIFRILALVAGILTFGHYRSYRLREGYRLIKRLEEPGITPKGKILKERVITLPGPFFEWPKLIRRVKEQKLQGIYMYLAKVPQIAWGLARNRRWRNEPYWEEGAPPEAQRRQIIINIIKDYVAPVDRLDIMTDEETDAIDNILSLLAIATYKRGGTEDRIKWQIQQAKKNLVKYIRDTNKTEQQRVRAIESYGETIEKLLKELEKYTEQYKSK